jgi:hypothetical protein
MYREEDCGCERHGHEQEGRMHHGDDCGCGGHGGESGGMHHGGGCCCGGHGEGHHIGGMGMGFRRFISRDEIISRLEEYLKNLQAEAKGVEERIAELKKGQE